MFYELMMLCHMQNGCVVEPRFADGLVFDDLAVCESVMHPLNPPEWQRTSTYEWFCSEQSFRPGEHRSRK